jgi:hypothetical protein
MSIGVAVTYLYRNEANFTLSDFKGQAWKMSDMRGNVVLVSFWATW